MVQGTTATTIRCRQQTLLCVSNTRGPASFQTRAKPRILWRTGKFPDTVPTRRSTCARFPCSRCAAEVNSRITQCAFLLAISVSPPLRSTSVRNLQLVPRCAHRIASSSVSRQSVFKKKRLVEMSMENVAAVVQTENGGLCART